MAMIHLEPQTAQMFSRALGALKPPPNLTLSQWADNYRRLSAEASAAQGRWNTDNAPFQREIMDAIGDVHIRKVVAMMCAQSGKTDGLILNTIGYYMSYYPAPIMIVQPTVNLGESFSKDRLATMIRDTPVLRGLVDNKSRYSGNTIMKKNFAGGQLTIVGANAPTDLRGRPIKVLLADEVDAYKASAGKEGDPVMLAEQRQTTYWDYKTVLVSTPTDKNNSRILDEFNASTQEEWTVPCPNCGFYQPFVWDNMVFDKEKWPEGGVQYRCAECGCLDNEYRWKKNSLQGKWHAEHPERSVRGFHMNKIGSTLCGWDKIVEDFIAADLDAQRGDYEKMQVFVNTDLGLPWEEPGEAVEANNLLDRREFYEAEVPDGVVYLTAGVDTQDNRFEAEVVGWGIGRESWGIRYQRIYGDLKRGQVWADLDEFLSRTWKKKDGTELSLRSVCMYVGIFGDVIFSVGHLRVLTPSNFKGTTGANWAEHEVLGGKARAEYLSPKLREYTFDILLDAALGVNPRKMLNRLTEMSENGEIHYLIIGFAPVSQNKFRVTEISDSWDSVIKHGLLMQCKVSLTIKEYI